MKPVRLEDLDGESDGRRYSPSAARNRDEILDELRTIAPATGRVLEIASGTGEHAIHFTDALPGLEWHPTDRDPEALRSIEAWRRAVPRESLRPAREFDVLSEWPPQKFDLVVAINFFHITPWRACCAFLGGAADALADAGTIFVYGAFLHGDGTDAPSNLEFDVRLREKDAEYGVRDLARVLTEAAQHGLTDTEVRDVPNNNKVLLLRKSP